MSLCTFIHRNLLFVTYCIQKCQKCCKIVRDRIPSLKKSAGTAFPRAPAPLHHWVDVGRCLEVWRQSRYWVGVRDLGAGRLGAVRFDRVLMEAGWMKKIII